MKPKIYLVSNQSILIATGVIAILLTEIIVVSSLLLLPAYSQDQDVGITIRVYKAGGKKKRELIVGPAGTQNPDGSITVPVDKIARTKNDYDKDLIKRVYDKHGNIVHEETLSPGETEDLIVGSAQLPDSGTCYKVTDPPDVLELVGFSCGVEGVRFILEVPVGGFTAPIDKLALLTPYIGLVSTILVATAATAIYVKRVKRRKEKK